MRSLGLMVGLAVFAPTARAAPRRIVVVGLTEGSSRDAVSNLRSRLAMLASVEWAPELAAQWVDPLPPPASQGQLQNARDALANARTAYAAGDAKRMEQALRQATDIARVAEPSLEQREILADSHQLRGIAFGMQENLAAAAAEFRIVHELSPGRPALSKGSVFPEVSLAYERTRIPADKLGRVRIDATPSDADLYIDGRQRGRGGSFELSVGLHYIAAVREEFAVASDVVLVRAEEVAEVRFALASLPAPARALQVRRRCAAAHSPQNFRECARDVLGISNATATGNVIDAALLVRTTESGGWLGAIYDGREDRLSEWLPLANWDAHIVALLPPMPAKPPPSPRWTSTGLGKITLAAAVYGTMLAVAFAVNAAWGGSSTVPVTWCGFKPCP